MNPAVALLGLRPLEAYVADFCGMCYEVGFNEVAFKGFFRNGLNALLNYSMAESDDLGNTSTVPCC